MKRIGDVWLVTTETLKQMAKIAEEHGADEGMLFIGTTCEVRDDPSPEGGMDTSDDWRLEWPKRPPSSPSG